MNEKKSFKETTEAIAFLAGAADGIIKALQDGKVSVPEAIKLVVGNSGPGLAAFSGAQEIPAELADAQPEEIDAAYQVFLEKRGWNEEPRSGFRDLFNEGILTIRQLLRFGRLAQNIIHPPKAEVIPDNLVGVDPP